MRFWLVALVALSGCLPNIPQSSVGTASGSLEYEGKTLLFVHAATATGPEGRVTQLTTKARGASCDWILAIADPDAYDRPERKGSYFDLVMSPVSPGFFHLQEYNSPLFRGGSGGIVESFTGDLRDATNTSGVIVLDIGSTLTYDAADCDED